MIPEIYINGINIGDIDIGGVDDISIDGFQLRSINTMVDRKKEQMQKQLNFE